MLKRSKRLHSYCQRPDILERMPGYSVRMGFGLHVGWAIEGAIGSEYKIDASYLSPNVNMAARLEAATKQFGTTILLSDDFVSLLSPAVRKRVRQVCNPHQRIDSLQVLQAKSVGQSPALFPHLLQIIVPKISKADLHRNVKISTGFIISYTQLPPYPARAIFSISSPTPSSHDSSFD